MTRRADGPGKKSPREVRATFSLYATDQKILEGLAEVFRGRGLKFDRSKLLRFLFHVASEAELVEAGRSQYTTDASREGPRETDTVAERFTLFGLGEAAGKVERVIQRLEKEKIRMNDSYLLRAYLRHLPAAHKLAGDFKVYLAAVPDGRTAAAIARFNARER